MTWRVWICFSLSSSVLSISSLSFSFSPIFLVWPCSVLIFFFGRGGNWDLMIWLKWWVGFSGNREYWIFKGWDNSSSPFPFYISWDFFYFFYILNYFSFFSQIRFDPFNEPRYPITFYSFPCSCYSSMCLSVVSLFFNQEQQERIYSYCCDHCLLLVLLCNGHCLSGACFDVFGTSDCRYCSMLARLSVVFAVLACHVNMWTFGSVVRYVFGWKVMNEK